MCKWTDRDTQIHNACQEFSSNSDTRIGFLAGAKWADEHRNETDKWNHPFATFTIEEFDAEIAKAKKQVIDKVFALLENTDFCHYYNKEFINELRKKIEV